MSEEYTADWVEADCLKFALPFRTYAPFYGAASDAAYLAIESEELACMIAFSHRTYGTALQTNLRMFSADCHARVTDPLTELWAPVRFWDAIDNLVWLATVVRVMRDETVFRTVRAVAAGLVIRRDLHYETTFRTARVAAAALVIRRDIGGSTQEAADVLVGLYADQPDPMLWLDCWWAESAIDRGLTVAMGIDLTRVWDYRHDVVRPGDMWNRLVHLRAPAGPTRDHYRRLADRLFGSLLLGFGQMEERGEIAVAHSAMLEEMLQEVSMQVVRDSA